MNNIKDENFIVIQGFMINRLHLKGNELLVYAIIYGFAQTPNTYFTGSRRYLASWLNVSIKTVQSILNTLVDKKLICRHKKTINKVCHCNYSINFSVLNFQNNGKEE